MTFRADTESQFNKAGTVPRARQNIAGRVLGSEWRQGYVTISYPPMMEESLLGQSRPLAQGLGCGECNLTSFPPPAILSRAARCFLAGIDSSLTDGGGHALIGRNTCVIIYWTQAMPQGPKGPFAVWGFLMILKCS